MICKRKKHSHQNADATKASYSQWYNHPRIIWDKHGAYKPPRTCIQRTSQKRQRIFHLSHHLNLLSLPIFQQSYLSTRLQCALSTSPKLFGIYLYGAVANTTALLYRSQILRGRERGVRFWIPCQQVYRIGNTVSSSQPIRGRRPVGIMQIPIGMFLPSNGIRWAVRPRPGRSTALPVGSFSAKDSNGYTPTSSTASADYPRCGAYWLR